MKCQIRVVGPSTKSMMLDYSKEMPILIRLEFAIADKLQNFELENRWVPRSLVRDIQSTLPYVTMSSI